MRNNVSTNSAVENAVTSEYKIGNTVYKVVTKFNFKSESLNDIISRLISKEIHKAA